MKTIISMRGVYCRTSLLTTSLANLNGNSCVTDLLTIATEAAIKLPGSDESSVSMFDIL